MQRFVLLSLPGSIVIITYHLALRQPQAVTVATLLPVHGIDVNALL